MKKSFLSAAMIAGIMVVFFGIAGCHSQEPPKLRGPASVPGENRESSNHHNSRNENESRPENKPQRESIESQKNREEAEEKPLQLTPSAPALPMPEEDRRAREGQSWDQRAENNEIEEDAEANSDHELACSHRTSKTPPFLRQDLAYSITGVDCYGDLPYGGFLYNVDIPEEAKQKGRAPAATHQCGDTKHSHPAALRSDLEPALTGLDCQGDVPSEMRIWQ